MTDNFNLSEKRHRNAYEDTPELDWIYDERDIKEFVKRLKDMIIRFGTCGLEQDELNRLLGSRLK